MRATPNWIFSIATALGAWWLAGGLCLGQSLSVGGVTFTYLRTGEYKPDAMQASIMLDMAFGKATIGNPQAWDSVGRTLRRPTGIDLVYTAYPDDTTRWFNPLTAQRLEALFALDPTLHQAPVRWRLVAQTDGQTTEAAQRLFHGFVIYYQVEEKALLAELLKQRLEGGAPDPRLLRDLGMSQVRGIISGDKVLADSVVRAAFARRPQWRDLLVVADWTSSMYPYGADLLRWHETHLAQGAIKYLVLFNDGDAFARPVNPRAVGATGGLYAIAPKRLEDVITLMDTVMLRGDGGDFPENDVEALRWGIRRFGAKCKGVVLIADNESDVRDLALLSDIKRPVHIILCSPERKPPHPHYLTIAWRTGGSVILLDDELNFLRPGQPISTDGVRVGGARYRLVEGAFRRIPRSGD